MWRLSSSRGIEVDKYKLVGAKTYREIFDELLRVAKINVLSFEVGKCYSFVMSHPEYHILPFKSLTFLGGYDFKNKNFFDTCAAPQFEGIKQENKPLGKKETLVYRLREQAAGSIGRYINEHCETVPTSPKLFGYILRSTHPDALDYYVESDLMETLKLGAFSTYRLKDGATNRETYFMMNIWLTGHNEDFWLRVLGPKYSIRTAEFYALLRQLYIHMGQIRDHIIHIGNIQSKIYADTIIYLNHERVDWNTIRSVRHINKYYAIWEEAHALFEPQTEIDE